MKERLNDSELLAPAGNMECLKAAVNAGADSIYIGGKMYSARASATNFDIEEIKEAVDYCLLRDVKLFVTINILYKQCELAGVINYISKLYEMGVTALIVQDIGLAMIIKEKFPDIRLHASTQMTAHSLEDVKFLESLGFNRIVLSRELSLKEIIEIKNNTKVEIETFVHGALCLCYSGQCLMSSMIGGRSGNRGRCAQPCRRKYDFVGDGQTVRLSDDKGKYLLSLKDMCTIDSLPELINAGIDSFKIEGRMKEADYVAGVVSTYRKYIDNSQFKVQNSQLKVKSKECHCEERSNLSLNQLETDKTTLAQLFNRGNFTNGYYNTTKSREMMSMVSPKNQGVFIGEVVKYDDKKRECIIKTNVDLNKGDGLVMILENNDDISRTLPEAIKVNATFKLFADKRVVAGSKVYRIFDAKLKEDLKVFCENDMMKHKISMMAELKINQPIKLAIYDDRHIISVTGDIVELASKNPLTEEKIKEQLSKTGNTPFEIGKVELTKDENIYINITKLNEIRREAISKLEDEILNDHRRNTVVADLVSAHFCLHEESKDIKSLTVHVHTPDQLHAAIEVGVSRVYIDIYEFNDEMKSILENAHQNKVEVFIALPQILRAKNSEKVYKKVFDILEKTDIDGYLIRTYGEFDTLKFSKKKKVIDYTLNIYNNASIDFWLNQKVENVTISPELNISEIEDLDNNQEIIVYGKLPVMFIEQCIIKNVKGDIACTQKGGKFVLRDEKKVDFELERNCNLCLNILYNSENIFILGGAEKIKKLDIGYYRINLTDEDYCTTKKILLMHKQVLVDYKQSSELEKYIDEMKEKGYTKGHLFRGVE